MEAIVLLIIGAVLYGVADAFFQSEVIKNHAIAFWKTIRRAYFRDRYPTVRGKPLRNIQDAFSHLPTGTKLDLLVYQLGIRPEIPLLDALYCMHLRQLLETGAVEKVLIFPTTDLSASLSDQKGFPMFRDNIGKLFGDYRSKLEYIDLYKTNIGASELISNSFNEAVAHIEREEVVSQWKGELDLHQDRVARRAFETLFSQLPFDKRISKQVLESLNPIAWSTSIKNSNLLQSTVHHINRTWLISKFLDDSVFSSSFSGKKKLKVGSVLWEIEIAKYGIFDYCSKQENSKFGYYPIFGKTVSDSSRTGAIPTHSVYPDLVRQPITIFGDSEKMLRSLLEKPKSEVRSYVGLNELLLARVCQHDERVDFEKDGKAQCDATLRDSGMMNNKNDVPAIIHVIVGQLCYLRQKLEESST